MQKKLMKKSLLTVLVMSTVASAAHADVAVLDNGKVNVEVYGILDSAVGHVQHSLSVDPQFAASVNPVSPVKNNGTVPSSVTGMFNGAMQDSRIGVKGSVDLGNDMKGFFTLEEGFNLPTGQVNDAAAAMASNSPTATATTASANSSLNGQVANRQAFAGLSDAKWGSIAVGRNYAPMYPLVKAYDPVPSDLFSPIGFSGTYGGGGGVSENTRVDSSLKYTNKVGSFNFGTLYKFGGTAGATSAKSGFTLDGGYEEGSFGVQAAYQAFNDALKGAPGAVANTVTVTNYDTKAFMIAAKYKFNDAATAKFGYETYTLSAPSEAIATAAFSYYGKTINAPTNFSSAPQTTHIVWVGGDYNLTEKLNLAVGLYDVSLQQSDDLVQKSGDQRYLSLLADYHLTKALDTYAGLMHASFSGNAFPTTGASAIYSSNLVSAVGVRFKF